MVDSSHTYVTPGNAQLALIQRVLRDGRDVNAANTRELLSAPHSVIAPAVGRMFTGRPNANHKIGIIEGLQLIAGEAFPSLLTRYGRFSDFLDGEIFKGAYGPRALLPLRDAIRTLMHDACSRQAFASIWRPEDARAADYKPKDIPCTIGFQFIMRAQESNMPRHMHMIVTMRSSDLWLGWTYDIVQFTMLLASVARCFNCTPGMIYINPGSLHIYDCNRDAAAAWLYQYDKNPAVEQWLTDKLVDEFFQLPYVATAKPAMAYDNVTSLDCWDMQRQTAVEILTAIKEYENYTPSETEDKMSPFAKWAVDFIRQ